MVGDAAWSLITQLSQADALQYLDDRKSRGFNTVLVEAMEHKFSTHNPPWLNDARAAPFANTSDFGTANAAFFDHVAWVVQQAADRGMLVIITPSYIGWGCADEGWCAEMRSNGTDKLYAYGQFLGRRLRNLPNIVWLNAGDHLPSTAGSPSDMDLVAALINGLKNGDGGAHLHTAHWMRGTSGSEAPGVNWLDLDSIYSGAGAQTLRDALDDWGRSRGLRPTFFLEGLYEHDNHKPGGTALRAQMYQPVLAGEGSGDWLLLLQSSP